MATAQSDARTGSGAAQRDRRLTGPLVLTLLILVGGVVLSAVGAAGALELERTRAASAAMVEAQERIGAIQREIDTKLEVLHATRALFESSRAVTPAEFATFTHGALTRHASIRSMFWAPHVRTEGRAAFERELSEALGAPFRITELPPRAGGNGKPVEAAMRPGHVPVAYVESIDHDTSLRGFDLLSDPARASAVEQARRTGIATMSPPVRIVGSEGGQTGVMLVMPIPSPGQGGSAQAPAEYVGATLVVGDLVDEALATLPPQAFTIRVYDLGEDIGASTLLLNRVASGGAPEAGAPGVGEQIAVGGRHWRIECVAGPAAVASIAAWPPLAMFMGGLLVTGLLALMVSIATGRARVQRLVQQQTAHLARMEAEARTSRDMLRLITDALPVYISYVGTDERYRMVNRCYEQWFQQPRDRIVGQSVRELLGAEVHERISPHLQRVRSGEPVRYQQAMSGAGGATAVFDTMYLPHIAPDGGTPRVLGFFTLTSDVTEHNRMLQALRQSEAKYRALIETTHTGFCILDEQGRVVDANAEYLRLTGRESMDQVIGRPVTEWTAPHDRERSMAEVRTTLETGGLRGVRLDHQAPDGTIMPVEIDATLLRTDEGDRILGLCRDIAQRRREEQTLREARWHFERAQRVGHVGSWVSELAETGALWWSAETCRIFGYDPDRNEFDGRAETFYSHVHPDDADAVRCAVREACAGERPYSIDHRIVRRDGRVRWVHGEAEVERTGDGAAVRMLGVVQDITDRREAEDAVRQSEERYRLVARATSDAVWDWDPLSDHLTWGDGVETLFGLDRAAIEAEVNGWSSRLHPDDVDRVVTSFYGAINDPAVRHWSEQYRFRRADGSYATVLDRAYVMRDERGAALRLVGAISDITERSRAEDALRRSEEFSRRIIEALPGGIVRVGAGGAVEQANVEAMRFLGLSWDELSRRYVADWNGQTIWEDGSPCHPEDYPVSRCLRTGQSQPPTIIGLTRPDGTLVWGLFRAVPLLDPATGAVEGVLLTFLDITQRKHSEEALRQSEAQLRHIFDTSTEAILIADDAGRYVRGNQAAAELLGWPLDVLLKKSVTDIRTPGDRPAGEQYEEYLRTGRARGEFAFVRPDGEHRIAEFGATALGGGLHLSIMHDATARKRTEQALRQLVEGSSVAGQAFFERLATALGEAMGVTHVVVSELADGSGGDGRPGRLRSLAVWANGRLAGGLEYELAGTPCERVAAGEVHYIPSGVRAKYPHVPTIVATNADTYLGVPLHAADGRPLGLLVALSDRPIDPALHPEAIMRLFAARAAAELDRLRAEDRLRDSEARYRLLFEANPGAMWVYDAATLRFLAVNQSAIDRYGFSREEFLSMTIADIRPPDEAARLRAKLESGGTGGAGGAEVRTTGPWRHRTRDGRLLDVEITAHSVTFAGTPARLVLAADVTEKLRAERALRQSEATTRALLDAMPDLLFRMNREGRYLEFHAPNLSDLLVPPDQFLGRIVGEVLPPHLAEPCMAALNAVFESGRTQTYEYYIDRGRGRRYWEVRAVRCGPDEALLLIRDITAAKSAQQRLAASEQRLSLLISQSPLAVIVWNPDFTVAEWNPAAERIFGFTAAEAIGRHAGFIIHAGSRTQVDAIWEALISGRGGGDRHVNENTTKDGRTILCDWYNSPIVGPDGRTIGAASIVQDVTDQKRADEAMRKSEERYRQLFESNLDPILLSDEGGRIVGANEAACGLLGRPRERVLSMHLRELSRPTAGGAGGMGGVGGDGLAQVARRLSGDAPAAGETEIIREGPDQRRTVEYAARRVAPGQAMLILRDITDRKQADRRQRMMMAELDHRVKNNLAAVLALAEQSVRSARSLDAFAPTFIGRLRAMARMHTALAHGRWEGAPLRQLIRQSLEAYMLRSAEAAGRDGAVGGDRIVAHGPDVVVPARAVSPLAMALHELATNAAKYGALSATGGRVDVSWTVEPNEHAERWLHLVWQEAGGPEVTPPTRRGFGTELIRGGIAYELHGEVTLDYPATGVRCVVRLPLDEPADAKPVASH